MTMWRAFAALALFLQDSFASDPTLLAAPPLAGAVIVVDAGHGGQSYSESYTGGTRGIGSRLTESELNLRVAFELEKLLRADGATVYMTRVADHRLSPEGSSNTDELHARNDFFEHHNCHFFLSVHHNAGRSTATGHTALYKHNAEVDTLYEALARDVNDALEGAVPGPKNRLIKGNYHILRETRIPGTIAESGFMTNPAFDALCNRPEYPRIEAAAIRKGAVKYWTEHKADLVRLREILAEERTLRPRDPKTYTAVALNPEFQATMKELLTSIAPDGKYEPARMNDYIDRFRSLVVTETEAVFTIRAEPDGQRIRLIGETSDARYHNQLIDMFVAMKIYNLTNDIEFPGRDGRGLPRTPATTTPPSGASPMPVATPQ